jgi:hypothetical protein
MIGCAGLDVAGINGPGWVVLRIVGTSGAETSYIGEGNLSKTLNTSIFSSARSGAPQTISAPSRITSVTSSGVDALV